MAAYHIVRRFNRGLFSSSSPYLLVPNPHLDFASQQRGDMALALDGLLDAHLGKAILRARSRGVSFVWQDGLPSTVTSGSRRDESERVGPIHRESRLHRCLSAAGGASVLHWGRVVGSTGLLPPSATLGPQLMRYRDDRCHATEASEMEAGRKDETAVIAVALNPRGTVDVHLVTSPMSEPVDSRGYPGLPGSGDAANAVASSHNVTPSTLRHAATPWRLMGTLPVGEVWPSCLVGQGWGATRVLQADGGRGAQLWRGFLAELLKGELAGVVSFPQRLFGCEAPANNDSLEQEQAARVSGALTVALLLPISGDCAVCFSAKGLTATPTAVQDTAYRPSESSESVSSSAEEVTPPDVSVASGVSIPEDRSGESLMRAESTLKARGAEVRVAMQESSLARKRRRQSKLVPVKGARGMNNSGSLLGGAENPGGLGSGGGRSGSLSQRDSGSLCFTAEGTSGDGAGYDVRQWRLEMASATSHGSASPRGYRLFGSPPGGTEDDEQMSSTGSSSGPKRALYQALEDVSSRSSLLEPDADSSSSTPGSKDGAAWSSRGAPASFAVPRNRGPVESSLRPDAEAAGDAEVDMSDVARSIGATELPLSLMSEPALACLPGPPLPAGLVALADRCALRNKTTATTAPAAVTGAGSGGVGCEGNVGNVVDSDSRRADQQHVGARRRFIESVRSLKRRREADAASAAAAASTTVDTALYARGEEEVVTDVCVQEETLVTPKESATRETDARAPLPAPFGEKSDSAEVIATREKEGRSCSSFEDSVRKGVAGLQMQYREVVEGGKRSPVEFVVCAVPEVSRGIALRVVMFWSLLCGRG